MYVCYIYTMHVFVYQWFIVLRDNSHNYVSVCTCGQWAGSFVLICSGESSSVVCSDDVCLPPPIQHMLDMWHCCHWSPLLTLPLPQHSKDHTTSHIPRTTHKCWRGESLYMAGGGHLHVHCHQECKVLLCIHVMTRCQSSQGLIVEM